MFNIKIRVKILALSIYQFEVHPQIRYAYCRLRSEHLNQYANALADYNLM